MVKRWICSNNQFVNDKDNGCLRCDGCEGKVKFTTLLLHQLRGCSKEFTQIISRKIPIVVTGCKRVGENLCESVECESLIKKKEETEEKVKKTIENQMKSFKSLKKNHKVHLTTHLRMSRRFFMMAWFFRGKDHKKD